MGPIIRIIAALVLLSVCQMAPARAAGQDSVSAGPSHAGPMIRLGQACGDEDRRREEEERRVKRRRRDSRDEHERLRQERARRWSEDRHIRTEQAVKEMRERQRKEREARMQRIQEGFETKTQRRLRARRARRLNVDRSALRERYPATWVVGIIEGRVEKGWTADAVRESWGQPEKISQTYDGEFWHYAAGLVVFSNGRVSDVVLAQPKPSPSGGR